ncbi:MAG: sugar kinase, partial [Spirochaetes bacterium GWD1_27_9]
MNKILVSGSINIENTLKIESFPLNYFPVTYPFFGVNSTISGVGYNLAKSLTKLGDKVNFASIIGSDLSGMMVRDELKLDKVKDKYVISQMEKTCASIIIYDKDGKRQIHCDLKDIQEQVYPEDLFLEALDECKLVSLCNINFSRPFLKIAKEQGKIIASDVHVIGDLNDPYNTDFMKSADILFMSNENLPSPPMDWIKMVLNKFGNDIIVIGLGKEGVLMSVKKDNFIAQIPAVYTRPIVNTIGAGDSLFSAFLHFYNKTSNPYESIKRAITFASYKIGVAGAADGFLNEKE